MARKIPLERTIGGAYGFLFGDLVSVIGIVWLPYLLFGGLAGLALWYGLAVHPLPPAPFDRDHFDLARARAFAGALIRPLLPVALCILVANLMATAGLTRKALGKMDGLTLIYFNLGASFWRLLAAYLLAAACLVGLAVGYGIIGGIWASIVGRLLPLTVERLLSVVAACAGIFFYIYAVFRLIFFVPAVVLAEDRIGLMRSWRLGGGNFWRIIVVLLLVIIPAAFVYGVLDGVVRAIFFGQVFAVQQQLMLQVQAGHPIDPGAVIHSFITAAMSAGPVGLALAGLLPLLFAIAVRALYAGAAAAAYLGVTEAETSQSSPSN